MRRLDRSPIEPPPCLCQFRHGKHNWADVTPDHRKEIRASLERMQGRVCAYCEGCLNERGEHIEHFRPRSKHPNLTFDWDNLLLCCDSNESCGHYKDRTGSSYNPSDLIDPCTEDPDRFFCYYETGTIRLREEGLTEQEKRRASETLRILNLGAEHGPLRAMRARAFKFYRDTNPDILSDLAAFTADERREIIEAELASVIKLAFGTVIRHYFERYLS